MIKTHFRQIQNREIILKTEEREIAAKLIDTGIGYDVSQVVNDSYNVGRSGNKKDRITQTVSTLWAKKTLEFRAKIDEQQYETFVNLILPQLNIESKDATLAIENGEIKETKEIIGQTVDTSGLPQRILLAASNNQINTLRLPTATTQPEIITADTNKAKDFAEKIIRKKVTLQYEDKAFSPASAETGKWINFDNSEGKISASLEENEIKAYLSRIARGFEIQKINRRVNALDGSVVVEGREGKYLDQNQALTSILNQINQADEFNVALQTYTEAPAEEKIFPAEGLVAGRFSGKYVDVDLTQQKLCQIEGDTILSCTLISSGKPGMATPTGTFSIQNKSPRQFSNKYRLYMPWWQAFKGDYGFHELPETNTWKEVPDHLGKPVSHGCVRLGVGPAESLYNWTEIGTPVYIHK